MELFLYGATPDEVIKTVEDFGASRNPAGSIWYYPNKSDPELMLHLRVQDQEDSERLGLGDTINTLACADLTLVAWESWYLGVAKVLDISALEARHKIVDASVLIRELNHKPATGNLEVLLLRLLKTWEGFAHNGVTVFASDAIHRS